MSYLSLVILCILRNFKTKKFAKILHKSTASTCEGLVGGRKGWKSYEISPNLHVAYKQAFFWFNF